MSAIRKLGIDASLALNPVGVEKGTRAVISVNFSACGERIFNNLRANFFIEKARKEFFNSHSLTLIEPVLSANASLENSACSQDLSHRHPIYADTKRNEPPKHEKVIQGKEQVGDAYGGSAIAFAEHP